MMSATATSEKIVSSGVGDVTTGGTGIGGAIDIGSDGTGGDGGGVSDIGSDGTGGGGGPGLDLKAYHIETEEINNLADDPKGEKIKKLAKNCSQGNKELCGWIMHKFGKIKEANPKGYHIILGYELNATKARKSNKPIFGIIVRQTESKTLKEIPVPKSCGDCVVPTVWRNNGDEKCIKEPKKLKPFHFCVKPCKEYLFQIFILKAQRYDNETFNGYENAQNYELLNRIGQIMKPKLFWVEPIDERNKIFKVNELSLNLSKININFPVFSDFLDLNKGSQEKVRNLLMTPEIIEFYVENPGLVTREVKQLLIALSDCYDVAKRYTGIFCNIAIDKDKIEAYGGGGEDEACQKLLKEKKIGRFNMELNVDNGCGGGGGKVRELVKNYAEEIERLKENTEYTLSELIDYIIFLNETNESSKNDSQISKLRKEVEKNLSKNNSLQKIKTSSSSSSGSSGSSEQPPLMFLQNCMQPYTCWIDSLLYFLYGFLNYNNYENYYMKKNFTENFIIAFQYLINGANTKNCLIKIDNDWNVKFLQSLLPERNEYKNDGFNDPVQVLDNILETIQGTSTTEAQRPEKPDPISQLIKPKDESIINYKITQDNFYKIFYEDTKIYEEKENFLFQSCAGRRGMASSKYRSLLLGNINIPIFKINKIDIVTYELKSFIVYKGGSHYVCYFFKNGQWWYYDDLKNEFTKENLLTDISKKINSTTDYIILYNYGK